MLQDGNRLNAKTVGPISRLLISKMLVATAFVGSSALGWTIQAASPVLRWQAQWIAAKSDASEGKPLNAESPDSSAMPIFRSEFSIGEKVSRATLRICGLGQFEAHINGKNVTGAVLTPGWTDYRKRVFYDTFDVTRLLTPGANAIGVMLGNGMYRVEKTRGRYTKFVGSFGQPKLIAQLDVSFEDGSEQVIASDGSWKTARGPIAFTSIYGGEDYDARLEQTGWDRGGFDAGHWLSAAIVPGPGGELAPEITPPLKPFETYEPVRVTHPSAGISVYDLGENFAGWPQIEVSGERGARIEMIPGELLDEHGFVTQRSAHASPDSQVSFTYILKGSGMEQWHPRFSYYGFRYVQVEQPEGQRAIVQRLEGRFLHDAVSVDGSFSSSDELLNRIHLLINRAMLSNMVSVLTDCPHREKLGWLEQTHLAGSSLLYNYDLSALYAKMADDMEDAQLPNGMVPDIAPEYVVFEGAFRDSPEWGAAVILSPWTAYQYYGDVDLLRRHYSSMARYIAYLRGRSEGHLLAYGLGDWYDIGPLPPGESQLTAKGLTATAIYYQSLAAMTRIAALLGRAQDASEFGRESAEVKDAFNSHFFHAESNEYDRGSQTANAMPLALGLVPEGHRDAVLKNLVADIQQHSYQVTAGDIGFHYVVRALTDNGRSDVLLAMLHQTSKPGYGYQLAHGATTLTEAWDSNPESSQNHFMLGHAEEWFYRGLGGIDFDLSRESDARILIHPDVVGDVRDVKTSFQSRIGKIGSEWSRDGESLSVDVLTMRVVVPAGATATVEFPEEYSQSIRLNGQPLNAGGRIHRVFVDGLRLACVVAGGEYRFDLRAKNQASRKGAE
jgi:hypothetical protein